MLEPDTYRIREKVMVNSVKYTAIEGKHLLHEGQGGVWGRVGSAGAIGL